MIGSAVVVASTAGAVLTLGVATAGAVPDVVDRPYSDAKAMIQDAGGTPVIATRIGGGADEGDCLVANAWEAGYPNLSSRGRIIGNNEVLVALNCNGELAGPGSPGNSALSPAGRAAKQEAEEEAAEAEEQELAEAATPGA
ncbi:hypothetical protein [Mycobacterium deserti]|uniref:PASTA domain-containing protein n=1 Tax=Mycobacterium deserti TaxID=2978347 RepID=A0ABT2M5W7_9MYCO|nr:hypothetical protein [Mycobacterium deserti]MCT7657653.1 hypothetical protein [Mycobacterium deserti]